MRICEILKKTVVPPILVYLSHESNIYSMLSFIIKSCIHHCYNPEIFNFCLLLLDLISKSTSAFITWSTCHLNQTNGKGGPFQI